MKKKTWIVAMSFAAATHVAAVEFYVEPVIGSHHRVDQDSDRQKAELMGGVRLGTELSQRLDAELGVMRGKPKGKNGYESKRENLGTLGVSYNLTDDTTGFIPYITGAIGTLDGINALVAGAGVKYQFADASALRLDVRDFIQNGDHHDCVTTIGYVIPFGKKQGITPVVEKTSVLANNLHEVQKAITAKDVTHANAVTKEVTFDTNVYFDFDKDVIKPSEATKLDTFVKDAKSANQLGVSLKGYTDVIGTEVYNKKLSMRRANVVKIYLERKGLHVKITAQGEGVKGKGKTKAQRALNRVVVVKGTGKVSQ